MLKVFFVLHGDINLTDTCIMLSSTDTDIA